LRSGTGEFRTSIKISSVLASHGEQAMMEVFQQCPPDHIIGETVAAASRTVLPPAKDAGQTE